MHSGAGEVGGDCSSDEPAEECGGESAEDQTGAGDEGGLPERGATQLVACRAEQAECSVLPASLGGADEGGVDDGDGGIDPGWAEQDGEAEVVTAPDLVSDVGDPFLSRQYPAVGAGQSLAESCPCRAGFGA
nr:hypothetical protein [Micromonospora eburnea]